MDDLIYYDICCSRFGNVGGQIGKQLFKLGVVRCNCYVRGIRIGGPVVEHTDVYAVSTDKADAVDDDSGCPSGPGPGQYP